MGPQFVDAVEDMIEDFDASRESVLVAHDLVGEGLVIQGIRVNDLIGEWLAGIPRIDPAWDRSGAVATVRITLGFARTRTAAARAFAKESVMKMLGEHLYEGALCRWVDHERESIVFGIVPRPGGEPGVSFRLATVDFPADAPAEPDDG